MFIWEREREHACMWERERGGAEEERKSQADSLLSAEPKVGLDLRTPRSWPESKSRAGPNRLSHPGTSLRDSLGGVSCTWITFTFLPSFPKITRSYPFRYLYFPYFEFGSPGLSPTTTLRLTEGPQDQGKSSAVELRAERGWRRGWISERHCLKGTLYFSRYSVQHFWEQSNRVMSVYLISLGL